MCALLFKQTTLYFAPAFFLHLFAEAVHGNCVGPVSGRLENGREGQTMMIFFVKRVTKLGLTVLGTAVGILLPFGGQLPQVLRRVFPLGRGVFEDYVSNIWCLLSPVIKLRDITRNEAEIYGHTGGPGAAQEDHAAAAGKEQTKQLLLLTSLALTALGSFGSGFKQIVVGPSKLRFLRGLFGSSLSFYLFSWQVHEKAILLPLLPSLLLLFDDCLGAPTAVTRLAPPTHLLGKLLPSPWCANLLFLPLAQYSLLGLAEKDRSLALWAEFLILSYVLVRIVASARRQSAIGASLREKTQTKGARAKFTLFLSMDKVLLTLVCGPDKHVKCGNGTRDVQVGEFCWVRERFLLGWVGRMGGFLWVGGRARRCSGCART